MNRYRNYMDRITAPASLHEKLLAGETPRRRRNRYAPAFALAAACCLLAVVGLWQPWFGTPAQEASPTAGVAATPGTAESAPPEQPTEHTLTVGGGPFQGQPRTFFDIPTLSFPDCNDSETLMVDYSLPEGWFSEPMTAQDILGIFGGRDDVPWILCWYDFGLDGMVIYNADGTVYNASIQGVRDTESFTLTLWPGQYPLLSTVYTDAAVQEVDGVEVTSSMVYADENGDRRYEITCRATFQVGDLGMDFVYTGENGDAATWLPCTFLWNATRTDSTITTEHLVSRTGGEGFLHLGTAVISDDRDLTLEEAYEEDMAVFFPDPDVLPAGFSFESAHRRLDQSWNTLSILFNRRYDYLHIRVTRLPAYAGFPAPDFQPGEVTAAALEEWGFYIDYFTDYQNGDTPGWQYNTFTVHYSQADGSTMVATWDVKGISPSDLAALVNGTAMAPPEDGPKVFPLE